MPAISPGDYPDPARTRPLAELTPSALSARIERLERQLEQVRRWSAQMRRFCGDTYYPLVRRELDELDRSIQP